MILLKQKDTLEINGLAERLNAYEKEMLEKLPSWGKEDLFLLCMFVGVVEN
jgi:hypothetical protein